MSLCALAIPDLGAMRVDLPLCTPYGTLGRAPRSNGPAVFQGCCATTA